ncbi:MAG: hypothetical protein ACLQOO_33000 [Terriglobia bacterium]
MKWVFASNDGGRDSGFHDAGVETFKGNFDRYLARELIQNSLDARLDAKKPVKVKFALEKLDRSAIPDLKGLSATFVRCADYWADQPKARKFFEDAAKLANAEAVTALRVGDYNTTGVIGSDTDRTKNWYNLIRCAGSSSKSGAEGGSFGIGKNAPFAASQMRTVLYSTYNSDREHVFQGVAMLASHQLPSGRTAQPTGYLGGRDGSSLRSKDDIPPIFLRRHMGTDIIVLGFPATESWKKDLVYSVLESCWPAIDHNDLVVTVGDLEISSSNLRAALATFSGEDDFTAHLYFKAFKDSGHAFHENLPSLGEVTLYLTTGDSDLPKRVAMVRKTGMVVFHKQFRSIVPFCGVFMCRNEKGNKLLRDMEPPRHDYWDSDHPEKGANRKTEAEYVQFIRDCVKTLLPADDAKVISVPGLNRFLPDDDESPDEPFDGVKDLEKAESAERSPLPEKIEGKKIDSRRSSVAPDHAEEGEGEGEAQGEDGGGHEEPGGGSGGSGDDSGNGDRDRKGGTQKGGSQGEQPKPSVPIRYRTFATNLATGTYNISVQSAQRMPKTVTLAVWAVGDDQRAPVDIRAARLSDGRDIPVRGSGLLGPLLLPGNNGSLQMEVRLGEPLRLAMEVAAHEAE